MYGDKSIALIQALAEIDGLQDLHIETNGAIQLAPFIEQIHSPLVRYIMDYKLPDSGEHDQMAHDNLERLREQDELKFVIGSEKDFYAAKQVLIDYDIKAQPLFSPVWETMPPRKLTELMLEHRLSHVKLNLQLHKIIWDPSQRGV